VVTGIGLQHVNDDETTQHGKPLDGSRGEAPSTLDGGKSVMPSAG